jgi:hypothetical protein
MTLVQYLVTSAAKITQPMIDEANALGEHDIARYLSEHQS